MILGYKDFWKDRFIVSRDVLSPRPETEGILTRALELLPPKQHQALRLLELGVGSGALILSLLREYPKAAALGIDFSDAALGIARRNAQALDLECAFMRSDWFSRVRGTFDLIVSNPPYITDDEMKALPKAVSLHDPRLALYGGCDGLEPYRVITKAAPHFINPNGYLIFEIGAAQGDAVRSLMKLRGFTHVKIHQDLAGHNRIVSGQYKTVDG